MKKNIIALVALILVFALVFAFGSGMLLKRQLDHYYPKAMVVYNIDKENDVVVLKDFNGNTWEFEGVEDWAVNDLCTCLMYDNKTSSIYDDEIVSTRYDGQVLGWIIK